MQRKLVGGKDHPSESEEEARKEPLSVVLAAETQLFRISASCPRCGSRPALRVSWDVIEATYAHPPGARLGTYKCHRRGCGTIYDLTAAAYQKAS